MAPKMGDRVKLVQCSDPHSDIKPGATGTVSFIDSLGTVHVDWDDGRKLGLVPGEDAWYHFAGEETYWAGPTMKEA